MSPINDRSAASPSMIAARITVPGAFGEGAATPVPGAVGLPGDVGGLKGGGEAGCAGPPAGKPYSPDSGGVAGEWGAVGVAELDGSNGDAAGAGPDPG